MIGMHNFLVKKIVKFIFCLNFELLIFINSEKN
jgi:hypothetical protein